MPEENQPVADSTFESPLERVLAAYIESLERGSPLDQRLLLEQHPGLAAELQSFFRNRAAIEDLADHLPAGETAAETVARGEVESARDGTVRLWDLETGQPLASSPVFRHAKPGGWAGADFAPDSSRLAVCGDDTIHLIDPLTGIIQQTLVLEQTAGVHSVSLSRDANLIACLTPSGARVYDTRRNTRLLMIPDATDPIDDSNAPNSVTLSPDGKFLAVTYEFDLDGELRIYEVPSRKLVWRRRPESKPSPFRTGWGLISATFSPDGNRVAAVGNHSEAFVYDAQSGTLLHRFDGEGYSMWGVAFSPDGKQLVTGGFDRTIRFWDLERGEERFVLRGHREPVQAIGFSPDGRKLVSGDREGRLRIWESDQPEVTTD